MKIGELYFAASMWNENDSIEIINV